MATRKGQISGLAVWGFKSVDQRRRLEVRPLTILAGANSSGKSSIVQPLLLLKQTLEAPADPGALLLDGPNVRFTSSEQLLSKIGRERQPSFGVCIELSTGESLEVEYAVERSGRGGRGFDVAAMVSHSTGQRVELARGMSHDEIVGVLPTHLKDLATALEKAKEESPQWGVYRDRCFLTFGLEWPAREKSAPLLAFARTSPADVFIPRIMEVVHLPGLRGNPLRTYRKAAVGRTFPGVFSDYVASVIAKWNEEEKDQIKALGEMLRDVGLSWKISTRPVDETQVELRVGRLPTSRRGGARDLVNIADVGFGVSQALPVLTALLAAAPGQLVYIEQPEIHLHPAAQQGLAQLLCDTARRGVLLVIETHSAILLRSVQTLVAKGEVPPRDVRLYWFQRDEAGAATVTSGEVDENGAYGEWPEDFDTLQLKVEGDYLDAVLARHHGA